MKIPGTTIYQLTAYDHSSRINYYSASAIAGGAAPFSLGGCIFGCVDDAIAAAGRGQVDLAGGPLKWFKSASGTTFSVGDEVWWDYSANLAVNCATDLDGANDFPLGVCMEAKASGTNAVLVNLYPIRSKRYMIEPVVYEFDCDGDNGDTDAHGLIPTWQNRHGLLFKSAFGIVTEQFAGDTEDQGVVTIEDTDGTDICTLTPSDGGADAVGDLIVCAGETPIHGGATGDAWKTVAAGKGVQGKVTTQCTGGTPAGKIKVYVDFLPLL